MRFYLIAICTLVLAAWATVQLPNLNLPHNLAVQAQTSTPAPSCAYYPDGSLMCPAIDAPICQPGDTLKYGTDQCGCQTVSCVAEIDVPCWETVYPNWTSFNPPQFSSANWPNGCGIEYRPGDVCTQQLLPLTASELEQYRQWRNLPTDADRATACSPNGTSPIVPPSPSPSSSPWPTLFPTPSASPYITPNPSPTSTPFPAGCTANSQKIIRVAPGTDCAQLQHAVDAVPDFISDYVIELSPGTYVMDKVSRNFAGVSIQNKLDLEIRAAFGGDVILDYRDSGDVIDIYQSHFVTIRDISIWHDFTYAGVSLESSSNIWLDNISVSGSLNGAGVYMERGAYSQVTNSWFTNVRSGVVVADTPEVTISHNHFAEVKTGVFLSNARNIAIFNNYFDSIGETGLNGHMLEGYVDFYNNTIVNSGYSPQVNQPVNGNAIVLAPYYYATNPITVNIHHNIIANNKYGVHINQAAPMNINFYDNNVWGNEVDYYTVDTSNELETFEPYQDQTGQNGNISADPLFGPDFCLEENSPSILGDKLMGSQPTCNPPATASCPTDFNADGITDLTDFSMLALRFLATGPNIQPFDINSDGIIDLTDYSLLARNFLQVCD